MASRGRRHTMKQPSDPKWSAEELGLATGEPVGRLRRLRSLRLIGSEGDERFAPEDAERVRLVQFLERRGVGLETIARAEREEAVLMVSGGRIPLRRRS